MRWSERQRHLLRAMEDIEDPSRIELRNLQDHLRELVKLSQANAAEDQQ